MVLLSIVRVIIPTIQLPHWPRGTSAGFHFRLSLRPAIGLTRDRSSLAYSILSIAVLSAVTPQRSTIAFAPYLRLTDLPLLRPAKASRNSSSGVAWRRAS